ncbi:MAG: PEGA domain-containing protein [Opitutaceae bacterium]|nr:PEGA domain-containing protein [Opitutaceae bacterium]MBP9913259.1 PEGA domain-containing protein [Opitutaceae bacterium]
MSTKLKLVFSLLVLALGASALRATDPAKPEGYTVAIFVANRAGTAGNDQLGALEDYITGRVTDLNVHVISGETALDAVGSMEPGAKQTALDAQLAQSTSAVRLAQTLGATHLLQVSIAGFDSNQRKVAAYGVKATNEERTVRVTYKILDGITGASLAADTVRVTKVIQQTDNSSESLSNALNPLLDDAAQKVAASLKRQIERGRLVSTSAAQSLVTVTLTTELADLYIPDVRIGAENTVSISESKFKVSALAATVEIDGIAVGTAPGTIETHAGLHKLRVVREGFKPWERTVNFSNGQKLNVALQMSDEGYARWKDATAFINDLKNGAKLTDGEVKRLEGEAKMLEQSGYKVDTKDAPQITNKSIF